jgi:hypothetical protein
VIRLLILAFCASVAIQPAGRKPITLDEFLSQPAARSLAPIWALNGKRFAYKEKKDIYLYDVQARKAKKWFTAPDSSAKDSAWQNRRVSSQSYQWFPNNTDLLGSEAFSGRQASAVSLEIESIFD